MHADTLANFGIGTLGQAPASVFAAAANEICAAGNHPLHVVIATDVMDQESAIVAVNLFSELTETLEETAVLRPEIRQEMRAVWGASDDRCRP